MEWKSFRVHGVFASSDPKNAWVYLHTGLERVGWKRIEPNSPDGCSNVLQIATAAATNGQLFVQCLMTDADQIRAIYIL
jgi:hypothetical protein